MCCMRVSPLRAFNDHENVCHYFLATFRRIIPFRKPTQIVCNYCSLRLISLFFYFCRLPLAFSVLSSAISIFTSFVNTTNIFIDGENMHTYKIENRHFIKLSLKYTEHKNQIYNTGQFLYRSTKTFHTLCYGCGSYQQ